MSAKAIKKSRIRKIDLRKYPIYDYGQVLDRFVKDLERLEAHITAHKLHVGWERDAKEIKKAIRLYREWKEEYDFRKETERLQKFFSYVSEKIMGWWC